MRSKPNREVLKTLSSLYSEISATVEDRRGLVYSPLPWLILLLSNGMSETEHRDLFQRIRSETSIEARMASTISVNPVHAVLTATRMLTVHEYYFQGGTESPYTMGIFTLKQAENQRDILSEITTRLRTHFDVSRLILSTGSLPLSVSLERVVGVLRENSVDYIRGLLRHVNIGVGVDYRALDALSKAEENLLRGD